MLLVVVACLTPAFCFGALRWEAQQIQLTAKPGDTEAVASFQFKNTGTTSITITQVHATCGCTTAELTKRTYAPGEAGEIKAVFTFGDRRGLQEKQVQVTTDEPAAPPIALVLRVTIPELITCTPQMLLWAKGTEITEQSAIITTVESHRIASIEITGPTPEAFAHRIEPVEPGRKYRLVVRPVAIAGSTSTVLRGLARFDDGTVQAFVAYALVK